jgi:hypothetical protein
MFAQGMENPYFKEENRVLICIYHHLTILVLFFIYNVLKEKIESRQKTLPPNFYNGLK